MSENSSPRFNGPVLIFLHIPKTAGSTFSSLLDAIYGAGNVSRFDVGAGSTALRKFLAEKNNPVAVSGHLPYGVHAGLGAKVRYVSFFRSPEERLLSDYYFLMRQTTHPFHARIVSGDITLADMAADRSIFVPAHYWLGFDVDDLGRYQRFIDFVMATSPEQAFDKACAVLEKIDLIGLHEEYQLSLQKIADAAGWRSVPQVEAQNVTYDRPGFGDLTLSDQSAVLEGTVLEKRLFDSAKERFFARGLEPGTPAAE